MSLPAREDPNFPEALKAARESRNLSYSDLARAIGISAVMPSRYENRDHSLFSTPSQGTWRKLNNFLASSIKTEEPSEEKALPLSAYSVDELITEIKRRGATAIQVNF